MHIYAQRTNKASSLSPSNLSKARSLQSFDDNSPRAKEKTRPKQQPATKKEPAKTNGKLNHKFMLPLFSFSFLSQVICHRKLNRRLVVRQRRKVSMKSTMMSQSSAKRERKHHRHRLLLKKANHVHHKLKFISVRLHRVHRRFLNSPSHLLRRNLGRKKISMRNGRICSETTNKMTQKKTIYSLN